MSIDRTTLIARKYELRRRLERAQRDLAQAEARGDHRQVRRLQDDVERLMAQEYDLRQAIDRSPGFSE